VRHGSIPELTATALSRQLLEGINYLHGRRVVHRDIKPMNLLLLSEDATRLKIGDFNSATQLDCKRGTSGMLSARGTQLYAAPELRIELEWNERMDVWACGLCIFFMVRSQQPFNSVSRQNARLLQQGRLPPVDWGAMSKPLVNLVRQCLVVQMRDRPSPMELVEHCIFLDSKGTRGGTKAEGTCIAGVANSAIRRCPELTSLASCGLIMRDFNTSSCSTQQQSPRQHSVVRALALRRYLRLEGGVPSSTEAWVSPL
jgi:serine/threonine protein kinase